MFFDWMFGYGYGNGSIVGPFEEILKFKELDCMWLLKFHLSENKFEFAVAIFILIFIEVYFG
jgi:hypothetical protein